MKGERLKGVFQEFVDLNLTISDKLLGLFCINNTLNVIA
jgi:hypothetical protein